MPRTKRITALNVLLSDSDDSRKEKRTFSIGFYTKQGEYRYMGRAVRVGVRQNQRKHDFIGVQEVDHTGAKVGHPTPVFIYIIKSYKGRYEVEF